jgi:hypothetical protein
MKHPSPNRSQTPPDNESAVSVKDSDDTVVTSRDIFADMEQTLDQVAKANPRLEHNPESPARGTGDLKELLQVSLAINSSLVLDDLLQMVMHKAIELMQAERGLIMLLDEQGELQLKSAYNLCKEQMMEEDFRISNSVTTQVARTAKAVYTSDAMADDRYSHQRSVVELHLRSIMCAPIIVRERVIGVIYLDNSSESKMFLKSDLYLFQLYAQMVSNALHNAGVYEKNITSLWYRPLRWVLSFWTHRGASRPSTQPRLKCLNSTATPLNSSAAPPSRPFSSPSFPRTNRSAGSG